MVTTAEKLKITLPTNTLKKLTENMVDEKSVIPITSQIRIKVKKGHLVFQSTNLEIYSTSWIKQEDLEEHEGILVNGKLLKEIARKIKESQVTIEEDEDSVKIYSNKTRYKIKKEDSIEDFPKFPKPKTEKIIEVKREDFIEALDKVLYIKENFLNKEVMLRFNKELILSTTDPHRLALASIKAEAEEQFEDEKTILMKSARTLKSILKTKEDEKIKIAVEDSMIHIAGKSFLLSIVETKYRFPRVEEIIDFENNYFKKKITVKTKEFKEALKRIIAVANDIDKKEPMVKIVKTGKNTLNLRTEDNYGAFSEEEIEVKTDEENVKLIYNPKYLLEAINPIEAETITIKYTEETLKIEKDNYIAVIAGMRET